MATGSERELTNEHATEPTRRDIQGTRASTVLNSYVQKTGKSRPSHSTSSTDAKVQFPRANVLTLNIGGLNAGLFDEIKLFANQSRYQVIHLQETKWRFDSEWQDNNWKFIRSGSSKEGLKQGGFLTMIHKSMSDHIECAHIIAGRLLHVRIYGGDAAFDCINCYNYVYAKDQQSISRRASFWQALARTLDNVPLRNTVMVAGDFNPPHHQHRGYCGNGVLPQKNSSPEDVSELTRLVEVYNLCLLNTWQMKTNPATFDFQRFQSQIDFIAVRRQAVGRRDIQTGQTNIELLTYCAPRRRQAQAHCSINQDKMATLEYIQAMPKAGEHRT